MRIAHIAAWHFPEYERCGPVVYLHHLARAQQWHGDEPFVVCASARTAPGPAWLPVPEMSDGVEYVHLCNRPLAAEHDPWRPEREAHDPDLRAALTRLLTERRPDVVHIHNFAGLSFDLVAAGRASGAKVVASLHNYMPLCSRDDLFFADARSCAGPHHASCSRCLGTMLGDAAYQDRHRAAVAALGECDLLLPVSSRVAEIYAGHGVRSDLLHVEHLGSLAAERLWNALGRDRVSRACDGEQPGGPFSPDAPLRIVFFGAGIPRKGAMVLLQALRHLEHPERVRVQIYGGLSDEGQLRGFAGSCAPALLRAVEVHPSFRQSDLPSILSRADVAALTPRWEDNGPQTVFEALAAGLPVVATRIGGIPDFVEHGRNGLLVPEGDSLALAREIDALSGDRAAVSALRSGIRPPRQVHAHAVALGELYRAHAAPVAAPRPLMTHEATVTPRIGDCVWHAEWPRDTRTLVEALALTAAFPALVPRLAIGLTGEIAQAGRALPSLIAAEGLDDDSFPDVAINPAAGGGTGRPIAEFAGVLVAAAGAIPPVLSDAGDAGDELPDVDDFAVTTAAVAALRQTADASSVAICTRRPAGHDTLAGSLRAVPWNRAAQSADPIDLLVVDGRDPVSLAAARGLQAATIVVACGRRMTPSALAAFGLTHVTDLNDVDARVVAPRAQTSVVPETCV